MADLQNEICDGFLTYKKKHELMSFWFKPSSNQTVEHLIFGRQTIKCLLCLAYNRKIDWRIKELMLFLFSNHHVPTKATNKYYPWPSIRNILNETESFNWYQNEIMSSKTKMTIKMFQNHTIEKNYLLEGSSWVKSRVIVRSQASSHK